MSKMKGARTYRASNHIMVRFWCGIFFILKHEGGLKEMGYEDYEPDLFADHLLKKEKRLRSMERQQHHKQRLLNGLSHSYFFKPSIWRESKWDEKLEEYVDTNRVKRSKTSHMQKCMKKTSQRIVRHLPLDALPPKGNHYRKVFDYWWTWI